MKTENIKEFFLKKKYTQNTDLLILHGFSTDNKYPSPCFISIMNFLDRFFNSGKVNTFFELTTSHQELTKTPKDVLNIKFPFYSLLNISNQPTKNQWQLILDPTTKLRALMGQDTDPWPLQ